MCLVCDPVFHTQHRKSHEVFQLSCPTHNDDCVTSIGASISYHCWGRSSSYFGLSCCSAMPMSSVTRLALSHIHSIALHILSAIISDKNGSFVFFQMVLAALAVLIQYLFNVSSSFILNQHRWLITCVHHAPNRFEKITCVSQPLTLSRVALLQDQFSLPKQNTL